jgi:hypothetical protein
MKSMACAESHIRASTHVSPRRLMPLAVSQYARDRRASSKPLEDESGRTICSCTDSAHGVGIYTILFPYPMAYKHQAAPCTTMCPSGSYYIEHHVYRHVFRPFREQHLRIPWLILRQTGIKSCILSICRRLICRAPCTCPQPGLKLPHLCHEAMKLSFGCSVLSHSTPSPC